MRKILLLFFIIWIAGCDEINFIPNEIDQLIEDTKNLEDPKAYAYAGTPIQKAFHIKLAGNHDATCHYMRHSQSPRTRDNSLEKVSTNFKIRDGKKFESFTESRGQEVKILGNISDYGKLLITEIDVPKGTAAPDNLKSIHVTSYGRLIAGGNLTSLGYAGTKISRNSKFNIKKHMYEFTRVFFFPEYVPYTIEFETNDFHARAIRNIDNRENIVISGSINSIGYKGWPDREVQLKVNGVIIIDIASGLPRYTLFKIELFAQNILQEAHFIKEKCLIETIEQT